MSDRFEKMKEEDETIVVTVYASNGEANERNYLFASWDRALEVAMNRAQEGYRTTVKRRFSRHTPWEERTFYPDGREE